MNKTMVAETLSQWQQKEALAESMIPMIGHLYRNNDVITSIFGRQIINQSTVGLLKSHRFVKQIEGHELSVTDTHAVLKTLQTLNLGAGHIDIGKLALKYRAQPVGTVLEHYLRDELADLVDGYDINRPYERSPQDVVLYGFGRIGRLLARILIEKSSGSGLRLRAIVVRPGKAKNDLVKRASLLRRDSVHGSFEGTIQVDEANQAIIANGTSIQVIYAASPSDIDYTAYGIENALIVDNTGIWRDEKGLSQHLEAKGAGKVLLTAPGKGELKNIVYGVNQMELTDEDRIVSAASCTTNAITPVLKVLNDQFGIESGHVETVHSYTNDQNLIDNYHAGERRGRSAALNMVITETGAAKAVAKALPELAGKLTGNAIRVPTPNVSMAILNLNLGAETDVDALNDFLREQSLYSSLAKQIDFTNSPEAVSSDFVGNRKTAIVDSGATIVQGKRAILYLWYDNEAGYSAQVVRLIHQMAGVSYTVYPR
ncbi:glyceraldehyde-3-phosphate dehydrogenase [Reinekea blandensis]|uniref:Glyceraldehyde-3-phosphate dehydrogenase n=1 Tax=Reinekea blandensis MED297 TaxID=314283 RepID=A4BHB7_9GAMM|nr:glyceraldehyde-3-phosphate dehydrogenase [Reinekea blandensis]EAR08465.1 glyceraldehyde-3-phosphate dehydrogenase, type I [Reinekea sp. MED297] [Reinekea blandensis MED297]